MTTLAQRLSLRGRRPSISLPSGISAAARVPLAVQLVQAAGAEARLLGVAAWCERVLGPMPAPPQP